MERSDSSDSSNADKEKDDEQDQQSCWVHNFVLEEGGFSLVLGGVECIPWGHGVEEHPILGNDSYYASRSVILQDIKTLSASQSREDSGGLVTVRGVLRDAVTNKTAGLF